MFKRPVTFFHRDGSTRAGRGDCDRRGHFVLEAKKLKAGAHTRGFDDGLLRRPHPRPSLFRHPAGRRGPANRAATASALPTLVRPELHDRLRRIWSHPDALDLARISAKFMRPVAQQLASLARSLEQSHRARKVAAYRSRCLFSMFAEHVALLPNGGFHALLLLHHSDPAALQMMLRSLWTDTDPASCLPRPCPNAPGRPG